MYENTAAEFRPELHAVVMEARNADSKFIGELLFPVYPVETRTGDYMRIKKGTGNLLLTEGSDALLRAPGTAYKEVGRTTEKDGWNCKDRGLTEPVDDVNAQNVARFFDSEAASAKLCERNVHLAYEQRVAQTVFSTAIWGVQLPLVNYTVALRTTCNFAEDLKKAKRTVDLRGESSNTLVMNRLLWDYITSTDLLRTYFFGTNGGNAMITLDMIAEKFGLEQILIAEASLSTAKRGKAQVVDADLQYIWPQSYFWVGDVRGGAPEEGGAGRTFLLSPLASELFVVESYRKEDIRSDVVRIRQDTDEKVINENCGTLVQTNTDIT